MLGIQSIAEYDFDEYRKSLEIFQEKIQNIHKIEINKYPKTQFKIYAFSDCAYMESTSLIQLIDFYSLLRSELFVFEIFFNAALCEGELSASIENLDFFKSTVFRDVNTVKVYQMQNKYKGIGITIDKDIVKKNNDQISNFIVKSIFQPTANEFKFTEYWDIKYVKSENDDSSLLTIIKFYVSLYSKLKRYNSNAARYYLSAISTLILQLDKSDMVIAHEDILLGTETTNYILNLNCTDVSYNVFHLLYINNLLKNVCGDEKNDYLLELCFDLLDKTKIRSLNLLSEFKEIANIPTSIMSARNKERLSIYLNRCIDIVQS